MDVQDLIVFKVLEIYVILVSEIIVLIIWVIVYDTFYNIPICFIIIKLCLE